MQEKKNLPRNNFSISDKRAKDYFRKREDIVLTKDEKGGATVIMDVGEYISKANQQLTEGNFYSKLNEDPTRKHSKSYYQLQLLRNLLQTTSEHQNFIFNKNT